jgi:hypothetical protein
MTRTHAWVKKGTEYVERVPMNWGKNLTLLGAMRLTGWVLLSTMFASTNKERFVRWLARKLLPRLKRGDVEFPGFRGHCWHRLKGGDADVRKAERKGSSCEVRIHQDESTRVQRAGDVSSARRGSEWLLRVARAPDLEPGQTGCSIASADP